MIAAIRDKKLCHFGEILSTDDDTTSLAKKIADCLTTLVNCVVVGSLGGRCRTFKGLVSSSLLFLKEVCFLICNVSEPARIEKLETQGPVAIRREPVQTRTRGIYDEHRPHN